MIIQMHDWSNTIIATELLLYINTREEEEKKESAKLWNELFIPGYELLLEYPERTCILSYTNAEDRNKDKQILIQHLRDKK